MSNPSASRKAARLLVIGVKVNEHESALLQDAAALLRMPRASFVRQAALFAAEALLTNTEVKHA